MERRDGNAPAAAYGLKEVAALLGLTLSQIRSYVRAGFLEPERGSEGELRFSFQDLVFLRLVQGLAAARIAPRRVHRALRRLQEALPDDRPLSGVRLSAAGRQLVVQEGDQLWNPESGQYLLGFQSAGDPREVLPFTPRRGDAAADLELRMNADDWYLLGCDLEEREPERAREAYQRALELDPRHSDARVNLGCFYHRAGKLPDAEAHYRAALRIRPDDTTACFNLGVVLEDQGRNAEARPAYEAALEADPTFVDAHYNLARLYDRLGDTSGAIRHLQAYRRLTQGS